MAVLDFSGSAMVALYPRETEAQALALDGEQPADSLHVTLIFLGTAREAIPMLELIQAVAGGVASETESLAGTIGGVAQFADAGDGAPLVLLPDVPDLTELGTRLRDELARIGVESASEHGFNPHLTVSYGAEPAAAEDRIGEPLHFDAISVVVGSDRFDYPLQSPPQTLLSDAGDCPCASLPSEAPMKRQTSEPDAEIRTLALRAQGLEGHEAIVAALTAAGVEDAIEPSTTYELTQGSLGERRFYSEAIAAGYSETRRASWPSEAELGDHGEVLFAGDGEAVFRLGDVIAHASLSHGWFVVRIASDSRSAGAEAVAAFSEAYPPLYADDAQDSGTVPITFWTNSTWGPVSRLRRIEASPWSDIDRNYAGAVKSELERLVADFEPGKDGQLLLWQGPPGTGKTWALRALASEWSDWAEFHYITDPDAFFVANPSYMIDVLLHDTYEELSVDDEILTSANVDGKWRVLILEDTGELLSANAKEAYGQGLSRLLNVVDGMVGQGLRVLALVTTNDELGDLHPAAVRPGRCASQIVFGPLSATEASEWLGESVDQGGTLAELYARSGGSTRAFEEETAGEIAAAAVVADSSPTNASQKAWRGTLMLEGKPTDDGRQFENVQWRDLPLSLMAQIVTDEGHDGAQVAGRIDRIWREGDRIMGEGVFDDSDFGQEVARLVGEKMLRGVSVDIVVREFELRPKDESIEEADLVDLLTGADMMYVGTDCSIGAVTVCAFPAFADAEISLVASSPLIWRVKSEQDIALVTPPLTAAGAGIAPDLPPAEWFEDPQLTEPTPLQITDEGRIFGHVALWDSCHIGFEDSCVLAPRSQSGYEYFHLGEVEVGIPPALETDGEQIDGRAAIPCGQITLGTGHASLRLARDAAVEHYDDTGTAAGDVAVGEDAHGIWCAGAVRSTLEASRIRELRGAKLSGDWRSVNGNLELVAILAVNVPGFPVPRVRVASADTEPIAAALVAAGVADRRLIDEARQREEATDLATDVELETMLERARQGEADRPFRDETVTVLLSALASSQEDRRRLEGAVAEAMLAMAKRQPPAPSPIENHVHLPQHDFTVHVDGPEVVIPEREVHVAAAPAPNVQVAAPPPAEVHVDVHPPARAIRVEEDPDGTRHYIPEEA